jgi:hypothetical protein
MLAQCKVDIQKSTTTLDLNPYNLQFIVFTQLIMSISPAVK